MGSVDDEKIENYFKIIIWTDTVTVRKSIRL